MATGPSGRRCEFDEMNIGDYHVFLSHAGEDKRDFVMMLHEKLTDRGVKCFLDYYSLPLGKSASQEMMAVAHQANIGIAVLSPYYMCKEWPLAELKVFLDRGVLMPLFYKVSPEECEDLAKSFKLHSARLPAETDGLLPLWRQRELQMTQAQWKLASGVWDAQDADTRGAWQQLVKSLCGISGLTLSQYNGVVPVYLEKVADEVVLKLAAQGIQVEAPRRKTGGRRIWEGTLQTGPMSSLLTEERDDTFVESVVQEATQQVQHFLEDSERGRKVVVMHGESGVGKTALAKNLALQHFKAYEAGQSLFPGGVFFLNCGRGCNTDALRKQFLDQLGVECGSDGSTAALPQVLRRIPSKGAYLLVLDNVWEREVVEVFLQLAPGKLLVTTQIQSLWTAGDEAHLDMPGVASATAILFSHARITASDASLEVHEVAHEIAQQVGCHPLALACFGARLRRANSEQKWRDALRDYRSILADREALPPGVTDGVTAAIKLSVDALQPEQRRMLLFIANFVPLVPRIAVREAWPGGGSAETLIQKLLDRHHLEEHCEPYFWGQVYILVMHELRLEYLRAASRASHEHYIRANMYTALQMLLPWPVRKAALRWRSLPDVLLAVFGEDGLAFSNDINSLFAMWCMLSLLQEKSFIAVAKAAIVDAALSFLGTCEPCPVSPNTLTRIVSLPAPTADSQRVKATVLWAMSATNFENALADAGAARQLVPLLGSPSLLAQRAAAAAMRNVARMTSRQPSVVAAGAVLPLVELLSSPSAAVQEAAARALWAIANRPDGTAPIIAADALSRLVLLLGSHAAGVQAVAAHALWSIAADHAGAVLAAQAVPKLVPLLESASEDVQEGASGALAMIALDAGGAIAVAESGAVPALVRQLDSDAEAVQVAAAGALGNFGANFHEGIAAAAADAVPRLVRLLGSTSAEVQERAVCALRCVVANANRKGGASAVTKIAVEPLVRLVECPSPSLQHVAADALAVVVGDADNQVAAASAGALPALLRLLEEGPLEVHRHAARALCRLAANTDIAVAVLDAGTVPALVRLLASPKAAQQAAAAEALLSVAESTDGRAAASAAEVVPPLVPLLDSSSPAVQEAAAGALAAFASHADNAVVLVKAAAVPPLVRLRGIDADTVQETAANALCNIATEDGAAVVAAGAVPILVSLLEAPSAAVQEAAAACLMNVALSTDNLVAVLDAGAVPTLIRLLASVAVALQTSAAQILSIIAESAAGEELRLAAEAVPSLVPLLSSQVPAVQETAARALAAFALHAGNAAIIVAAAAVPPLVRLLGSETADVQELAVRALWNIAASDAATVVAAGAVLSLTGLLEAPSAAVQEAAAGALCSITADAACHSAVAAADAGPALVRLLSSASASPAAQVLAAGSLRNIALSGDNIPAVLAAGAVQTLVALLEAETPAGQEAAAGALAALAMHAESTAAIVAAAAVPPLVTLLDSHSADAQEFAVKVLWGIAAEDAAAVIAAGAVPRLEQLQASPSDRVREAAAGALHDINAHAMQQSMVAAAGC